MSYLVLRHEAFSKMQLESSAILHFIWQDGCYARVMIRSPPKWLSYQHKEMRQAIVEHSSSGNFDWCIFGFCYPFEEYAARKVLALRSCNNCTERCISRLLASFSWCSDWFSSTLWCWNWKWNAPVVSIPWTISEKEDTANSKLNNKSFRWK